MGLNFLEENKPPEAKEVLIVALSPMSEEEIKENPEISINLAHANLVLGDFVVAID